MSRRRRQRCWWISVPAAVYRNTRQLERGAVAEIRHRVCIRDQLELCRLHPLPMADRAKEPDMIVRSTVAVFARRLLARRKCGAGAGGTPLRNAAASASLERSVTFRTFRLPRFAGSLRHSTGPLRTMGHSRSAKSFLGRDHENRAIHRSRPRPTGHQRGEGTKDARTARCGASGPTSPTCA